MTDIDKLVTRIEDETAAKMRVHNLKQAHKRLGDIRSDLRNVSILVEGEPDNLTGRIATIIVNSIEPLMWKIETAIREGK